MPLETRNDWPATDAELLDLFGPQYAAQAQAFIAKLGPSSRSCTTTPVAGACKLPDGKAGNKYKIVCTSSDGTTTDYICSES